MVRRSRLVGAAQVGRVCDPPVAKRHAVNGGSRPALPELGWKLVEPLTGLYHWAIENRQEMLAARSRFAEGLSATRTRAEKRPREPGSCLAQGRAVHSGAIFSRLDLQGLLV